MAIVKFSFTALVFAWVSSAALVESEWTIFLKFEYKCGQIIVHVHEQKAGKLTKASIPNSAWLWNMERQQKHRQ